MNITDWIMVGSTVAMAVATIFTALYARAQNKNTKERDRINRKENLDARLAALLALTVQYPYLEHRSITEGWSKWKKENNGKYDERFNRYDQFANMLFNYLVDVYDFYDKDQQKIDDYLDVKGWVRIHRQIWEDPLDPHENVDGYSPAFRSFINSYIK